jgi:hypothetical protein
MGRGLRLYHDIFARKQLPIIVFHQPRLASTFLNEAWLFADFPAFQTSLSPPKRRLVQVQMRTKRPFERYLSKKAESYEH